MESGIRQNLRLCIACTVICGLVSLGGCRSVDTPSPTHLPDVQPTSPPNALPQFVLSVYPKPGEQTIERISVYDVGVTLRLEEIVEKSEVLEPEEVEDRVEFLIDGQPVDTNVSPDIWPETVNVQPVERSALSLGEHTAMIKVERTAGGALEYGWSFIILGEIPTLEGLPKEFLFVRPLPDSTVTLQSYRGEQLVPSYYNPGFADLSGAVCVGVLIKNVVERGEILDVQGVSNKYGFVSLDGVPPDSKAVIEVSSELGKCELVENGQVITSYPCPSQAKCWKTDLDAGLHQAAIRLITASGKVVEYSWQFTVTDD